MKLYKRKKVEDDVYLKNWFNTIRLKQAWSDLQFIGSIHLMGAIVSSKETILSRNQVIAIFEDKQNFIYCHKIPSTISGVDILHEYSISQYEISFKS